MEVLGIRYCQVGGDTEAFARFLRDGLGVAERDLGQSSSEFTGAIFHAGDSRIELWPESDGMPATVSFTATGNGRFGRVQMAADSTAAKASGVIRSG